MTHFVRHCGIALLTFMLNVVMLVLFIGILVNLVPVIDQQGAVFGYLIAMYMIGTAIWNAQNLYDTVEFYLYMRQQEREDRDFEARFRARFVADDEEAGA